MNEMKVAVARCLRKFEFELVKERPATYKLTVVMATENGMYLKVKDRKQHHENGQANGVCKNGYLAQNGKH